MKFSVQNYIFELYDKRRKKMLHPWVTDWVTDWMSEWSKRCWLVETAPLYKALCKWTFCSNLEIASSAADTDIRYYKFLLSGIF